MTNYVDGKVIIVTGAASGFGKVLSLKAAQLGGHIVCADINGDTLQTAVEEIETAGGSALAVQTDVTDADSMRSLVARGVAQYGQIDVLVNNAGIMPLAFFSDHEQASEAWNRCIDINFKGVLHGITAVYDHMVGNGRGHVVNISSIAGIKGIGSSLAYASSKGALNTMTKSMARNLGPIRVNAICPGFIQGDWLRKGMGDDLYNAAKENLTSTTPLKLTVTPEQVAEGIYNFIEISKVVTGETMLMDGGHHLIV